MNTTQPDKICFIFGTRPEIIKVAPIIKECIETNTPFITIHTGQHYSENMDQVFFTGLQLPAPDYNLKVGSASHGKQTAAMLSGIEEILSSEMPTVVVVQGDTNSVLAGALAASKLHIDIAHVEAGLRSYDRTMPEELNRVLAGSVARYHFTPTLEAKANLLKEGVNEAHIHVVGNTIVDAVLQNRTIAASQSQIHEKIGLKNTPYSLITIHRPENTDFKERLEIIIDTLAEVSTQHNLSLVWPIHPRTQKQIEVFGLTSRLDDIEHLHVIEPVDFLDMLSLQQHSTVTLTDSGGIQEESCILKVPCVTIRNNTERPESVSVGANILAGCDRERIMAAVASIITSDRIWENPFGDGLSAKRILQTITGSASPIPQNHQTETDYSPSRS